MSEAHELRQLLTGSQHPVGNLILTIHVTLVMNI